MGVDTNYTSLSINYDGSSGVKYISSMEHKTYPFFGVQFHPEKIMYEWTTKEKIPHSPDAVIASQYFATFFVNQGTHIMIFNNCITIVWVWVYN